MKEREKNLSMISKVQLLQVEEITEHGGQPRHLFQRVSRCHNRRLSFCVEPCLKLYPYGSSPLKGEAFHCIH